MIKTSTSVILRHTDITDSTHGKVSARSANDLPLEVIGLLDVFARIEARRQARLHDEQQREVK